MVQQTLQVEESLMERVDEEDRNSGPQNSHPMLDLDIVRMMALPIFQHFA